MTTLSQNVSKLLDGKQFTASYGTTVASGSSDQIYLENPTNSERTILVDTQLVRVDSAATGEYYKNPDISGGTTLTISNDKFGSSETTVANAQHSGTLSNADGTTIFPLAETGGTSSGFADRPEVALMPGDSVGVEINSNASDNHVLFLITFYETAAGV